MQLAVGFTTNTATVLDFSYSFSSSFVCTRHLKHWQADWPLTFLSQLYLQIPEAGRLLSKYSPLAEEEQSVPESWHLVGFKEETAVTKTRTLRFLPKYLPQMLGRIMILVKAFKQARNDRATKVVWQSEPSSKLPLLTESRGEMALEFRSSFIKLCKIESGILRKEAERHVLSTKVSFYLRTRMLLSL